MKRVAGSIIISLILLLGWGAMQESPAKVPEPDNIFYGSGAQGVTTLSLKMKGFVVAYYTMGDDPEAEGAFILRAPLDTIDPQTSGTVRPGDRVDLYINDAATPFLSGLTIGPRGTVQQVSLQKITIRYKNTDIPSGTFFDFGQVPVGTRVWATFAVINTGFFDLSLTGTPMVAVSGDHARDFTVTQQPESPLIRPNLSTTFTIRCAPSAPGLRTATITIASTAYNQGIYTFTFMVNNTPSFLLWTK